MTISRAVVFANGEFHNAQAEQIQLSQHDFILCVDGGVRHCLNVGLQPNMVVGDLDSIDEASALALKRLNVEFITFPSEKDASDLELALHTLEERSCSNVVVLGATGARADHHLFNWQLFGSREWRFHLRVVDATVDAHVVQPNQPFHQTAKLGQVFSVVPVAAAAKGVSVIGARYALKGATLEPGSTVGLSNVVDKNSRFENGSKVIGDNPNSTVDSASSNYDSVSQCSLQIGVESGIVLVMLVHQ